MERKKKILLDFLLVTTFFGIITCNLFNPQDGSTPDFGKCEACDYVEWVGQLCDAANHKQVCALNPDTPFNQTGIDRRVSCEAGELLNERSMACKKAPMDVYLAFVLKKLEGVRSRSQAEIAAKGSFIKEVGALHGQIKLEKKSHDLRMKGKVTGLITTFKSKQGFLGLKTMCDNNPRDKTKKDLCDVWSKILEHFTWITTGKRPEECGADQAFDFSALKCVDKELAELGLEILSKITSEKSEDANVDTIQKSMQTTISELLNLFKADGYADDTIVESLKKQSVSIAKTLSSLCTGDDEKAPYCALINKISEWFDQVVFNKTPCKNGQIFDVDMTRQELQCLDLNFVSFMKKLVNGYMATVNEDDPAELKEFQKLMVTLLDTSMTDYETASNTDTRTTSQRQSDFLKNLKLNIMNFAKKLNVVCPKKEGLEIEACKMVTKAANHIGMLINDVDSCPHQQIFDFTAFKCIDVIFIDFAKSALQEVDTLIGNETDGIFTTIKQSLDAVMVSFKTETTKTSTATTTERFAEFEKVLRAEAKKVINFLGPKCEIKNSTHPSVEDSGCIMLNNVFDQYKKLLDNVGATKCPLGQIFDEDGLRCVDMHVVEYAQRILEYIQSEIDEDVRKEKMYRDPYDTSYKNETKIEQKLVTTLKAFITKVKVVAKTSDTSAVKLEKVKKHGEDEVKAMIGNLREYCSPLSEDPICPKALVLGQNVVGFLFNKMFTEGCGLNELFDLTILKCVDNSVYDSLKNVFKAIGQMKPESETSKVVHESLAAVLPRLVEHVQRQAKNASLSIDLFNALLETVKDEINSIIKMSDTLCKDVLHNTKNDVEHNINYAMCYMVKNVTKHFEMIANSKWDMADKSCGAGANWQDSILDCVDIHFVVFVQQILNEVTTLDKDMMTSKDSMPGQLMNMMKRIFNIYKQGDQAGKGHEELFEEFLTNARDGGADVMRQMTKVCNDIIDSSDNGTDESMICSVTTRLVGNFGANIIGETKDGRACRDGQLINVEILKCVDVAFIDMAQKMMNLIPKHFGEHLGNTDNATIKTLDHFMKILLTESKRHDLPVHKREQNLLVFLVQQSKDMMRVLGQYCNSINSSNPQSFENQLCQLVIKLGSTMTKAMLFTTDGPFDDFVDSILVTMKFMKQDDADVILSTTLFKDLYKETKAKMSTQLVITGDKFKTLLESAKSKIKPLMEAVKTMCQEDEKAGICLELRDELEKFASLVSQRCAEGETFDYKIMECKEAKTSLDLFNGTMSKLKKLAVVANTKAAELQGKWIGQLTKLEQYAQQKVSNYNTDTVKKELENLFTAHQDFCKPVMATDSMERDVVKEGLCQIGNTLKRTLESMLDDDNGKDAKKLCTFVNEHAKIPKCDNKMEKFCAVTRNCIHKDRHCRPEDSSAGKEVMKAGEMCKHLHKICDKHRNLVGIKPVCDQTSQSPIFKDVIVKDDQTVGTLVSIVLREMGETAASLNLDESSLKDEIRNQWDWKCGDSKKLGDCKIQPKSRLVGNCFKRPVLLKGRTEKGRMFYLTLVNAHSRYSPPQQHKIKEMAVKKRKLFDNNKEMSSKESQKKMELVHFQLPPSRDLCQPMKGFKQCKELAVHVVWCKGDAKGKFIVRPHGKNDTISFECGKLTKKKVKIPLLINIEFMPFPGSTEKATLAFAYACVDGKQKDSELEDPVVIDKTSVSVMDFAVELPPPTFRKDVIYAPPVPVLSTKNKGFFVKELMTNDPWKYAWGKVSSSDEGNPQGGLELVTTTAVEDIEKFTDAGGVMYEIKTNGHGKFQYQCGNNQFADFSIPKGQHLLLAQNCRLKFVASKDESNWNKATDRNWADGDVSFKGRVCNNMTGLRSGVQALNLNDTNKFGDRSSEVRILRAGCKGKLGGMIAVACDNAMCSDAELQCDVCVGGQSNVIKNPKYFMGQCCNTTWCRGKCQDGGNIVDCNGDVCGEAYLFEPCKQCMTGTRQEIKTKIMNAFDDCKQCKNAQKTCDANSMIVKPTILQMAPANLFTICMNKNIKDMTCKLVSQAGNCDLLSNVPAEFKRNQCPQGVARSDANRQCIKRYAKSCTAGTYNIECTHSDGNKYTVEQIVIQSAPVLTSVSPRTVKPGFNSLEVTLTGFNTAHKYKCCRVINDNDIACANEKTTVDAQGKMKCKFNLDGALSTNDVFKGYIESCLGSATNQMTLTYACEAPVVESVKATKKDIKITFSKPSVQSTNAACEKFRFINSLKWAAKLDDIKNMIVGNVIKIPKVCLSCDPSATGTMDFTLDLPVCKKPHRDIKISTCDMKGAMLGPVKGFMDNVEWSVEYAGNAVGDNAYLQSLNQTLRGKKFIKLMGSQLRDNQPALKIKFKGSGVLGTCENSTLVNVTQEQSGLNARLIRYATSGGKEIYRAQLLNACGKRSSFKGIAWKVFVDGNARTNFDDIQNKRLFVDQFYGYDSDRKVKIFASVTAADGTVVETDHHNIVLRAKKLALKLNRGKAVMFVSCDKKDAVIRSLFEGKRQADDQYNWRCEDNGQACLNQLGEAMTLKGSRDLRFDPSSLLCGKRYTFVLSFLRKFGNNEEHNTEASVDVYTRNELPPKMSCLSRRRVNDYVIKCIAKGTNNITLENIMEKGDAVDFDKMKLHIKRTMAEGGSNTLFAIATIDKQYLTSFSTYAFRARSANENGESTQDIRFTTAGPPANCQFKMEPEHGIVYNTTFALIVAGCEVGNDATVMYRAILDFGMKNGKKDMQKTRMIASSNGRIFERKLRQSNYLNNTVTIIAMAIANGEKFTQKLTVTVEKPAVLDTSAMMEDATKEAEEILQNGDTNTYLDVLTDSTAVVNSDSNTDQTSIDAYETSNLQKCVEVASTEGVDKDLVAQCVRICTRKEVGEDSLASDGKKNGVKAFIASLGITFKKAEASSSARKRRSLDASNEETITWLSESEVESLVSSNNGILFPIGFTNTDQDSKSAYLAAVLRMQRSLSKLWVSDDFSMNEENIHLSLTRVSTVSDSVKLDTSMGNEISFGKSFQEKYQFWQCSDGDDICNGVFIGYTEVKGDLLSNATSDGSSLVTSVMNLNLINPFADGDFAIVKDANLTANVTLKVQENSTNAYCHSWSDEKWSVDACSTAVYNEGYITCICQSFVGSHIAGFKVSELQKYNIEMKYTTTPVPTTTKETTTTTSIPTVSTKTSFSFDANYQQVISKFGTVENARSEICTAVRYDLSLKTFEFTNCTIANGSVVVSFVIVQPSADSSTTLDLLRKKVADSSFTVTVPGDSTSLPTKKSSIVINGKSEDPPKPPPKKKDDGGNLWLIIGAIVGVVVIVAIIIAIVCCLKKNKRSPKVENQKLTPPSLHKTSTSSQAQLIVSPQHKKPSPDYGLPPVESDLPGYYSNPAYEHK